MPKTFEKTRKEIAKKKNGNLSTLHEKSRDARKLHKAQVRDERLERLAEARKKRDQPLRKWQLTENLLSQLLLTDP